MATQTDDQKCDRRSNKCCELFDFIIVAVVDDVAVVITEDCSFLVDSHGTRDPAWVVLQ